MRSRFNKLYCTSGIFTVGVGIAFIVISLAGLAMSFSILKQPIKKTTEAITILPPSIPDTPVPTINEGRYGDPIQIPGQPGGTINPNIPIPHTPTRAATPNQPTPTYAGGYSGYGNFTPIVLPTLGRGGTIVPTPAGNNSSGGSNQSGGGGSSSGRNNPASCTIPGPPVITGPLEEMVAAGSTTITWNSSQRATKYFLRINDGINPYTETFPCAAAPSNPGDLCLDNLTTTSYTFTSVAGHRYDVWLHATNECGGHEAVSAVSFDVLPASQITPAPPGSCDSAPAPVQIEVPAESIAAGKHLVRWKPDTCPHTRYFVRIDDQSNPWNEPFPCPATPSNSGDICKDDIIAPVLGQVDFVAGHTYSLWIHAVNNNKGWNIMGSKTITVAGPGATGSPSGTPAAASITPSATATPSATFTPSPTPTMCLPLPIIEWKDPANKFTRKVITFKGSQTLEIIALHLKQITQSGVVVLVSTDNGATWNRSDSSENDDHFITVKNRQGKTVSIQIKLQDTCNITGEILTVDVPPVPVNTDTSKKPAAKPANQKKIPVAPILITGAAAIGLIAAALFFTGL